MSLPLFTDEEIEAQRTQIYLGGKKNRSQAETVQLDLLLNF